MESNSKKDMQNQRPPETPQAGQAVTFPKAVKNDVVIAKLAEDLSQALRTLRMLEERYSNLRKKMQVSDENTIEDTNKIFTHLKLIASDISELKLKAEDMRQKLEMFAVEMKEMASKQDFKILQKYVEMWEPMQFLTEKQAISLIKDALKQKRFQKE